MTRKGIVRLGILCIALAAGPFMGCRADGMPGEDGGSAAAAGAAKAGSTREASMEHADPYAKPGFVTLEEEGRLWVLRPGEEKSEKHITLVGAGPKGMTIKALDRETALEYIAARPGFQVIVEEGRLWVLRPGEEKSEKHITLVGAGPLGTTLKALDRETIDAYLAAAGG